MSTEVQINETSINALNILEKEIKLHGKIRKLVILDFKVTSEEYHDITTLLYQNRFNIQIPSKGIEFLATIYNYSTSLTNLYVKGNVGDYHLELIEQKE